MNNNIYVCGFGVSESHTLVWTNSVKNSPSASASAFCSIPKITKIWRCYLHAGVLCGGGGEELIYSKESLLFLYGLSEVFVLSLQTI